MSISLFPSLQCCVAVLALAAVAAPALAQPALVPELVFEDNFVDNRHNWPIGRIDNATFTLRNGEYNGEERKRVDQQQVATVPVPLQPDDDFIIEAEYRTDYVGTLAWGVANTHNMQLFGTEPDNGVSICRFENGGFFWTCSENLTSRAVRNKGWNTLRLERRGAEVTYFINEKEVGRFPFRGRVGPGLGLETNRGSTARLRRLRVWHLVSVAAPAPVVVAPAPAPVAASSDALAGPVVVGQRLALNNVFFVQGKPVLLPGSFPELTRLAKTLLAHPALRLRLEGHTDNVGNATENQLLSEKRVATIKAYLAKRGVMETQLETQGFGGSRPVAPNDTEENKRRNRRVEFVVLE